VPRVRFEIQLETEASELSPSPLESDSEGEQLRLSRAGLVELIERLNAIELSILLETSEDAKDFKQGG
jgi:hypothetical protein